MRRFVFVGALALAAGLTVINELALGATASRTPPRAYLDSIVCHRALSPARRVVSVTAVMRPLSGTMRLGMRFQLLGAQAGKTIVVRGGDLGTWLAPNPITLGQQPADVWIVRHPVTGVQVPAVYRFRVSFRWTGADRRTIRTTVRWSQRCSQPDMRPDLLVKSIQVNPVAGSPTEDQYVAVVANAGLTPARSVEVQFSPGGGAADRIVTIPKLAAHSQQPVSFVGPLCTTTSDPTVTVDPQNLVNDIDSSNNSLVAPCPAQNPPAIARKPRAPVRNPPAPAQNPPAPVQKP